uniref:Complement component 1 Q subcomponent-binding protein, mitochondrial n=1 Tax=Cacopsylla melanoneura TaxID=428564 RepID=A0A8D8RUM7_9HEMI
MNKLFKSTLGLVSRNLSSSAVLPMRPISSKSLFQMSIASNKVNTNVCQCRFAHGKGKIAVAEKELFDFLSEEIQAEKKIQKSKTIPSEIDGFQVKLNGPEVAMEKTVGSEKIEIHFNVNHSVDADAEPQIDPSMDEPEIEMKSKPTFEVNFLKGKTTLGFTCSFIQPDGESSEDGYNDLFSIDEVTIFDGEWKDSHYAVSGEVLDGPLYDLLMNYLEEKGISNEFVDKLSKLSTGYEHASYINLLSEIQKFTSH